PRSARTCSTPPSSSAWRWSRGSTRPRATSTTRDRGVTAAGRILFLCTGNATRSVLGGAALAQRRPDLAIETAGTLVIEGLPMSFRTRAGFDAIDLAVPRHRSRQATAEILECHDLVVAMAPEHVQWVRREHPV